MSAIIKDIVNQALQMANVIDSSEEASGTDAQQAVTLLNLTLSQLNTEQLFPYSCKVISYAIASPQQSYTIGQGVAPSAEIVAERPAFIERVLYFTSLGSQPRDLIQLALPDLLASTRVGSSTPQGFAVNPLYPNAEIYFDIAPSAGSTIKVVYNAAIPTVTINSTLEVPPEYNEVLVTALARKVCVLQSMPEALTASINTLYQQALGRITLNNSRNQVSTLSLYGDNNRFGSNGYQYEAWGRG
jgi:hypothetical protein